VVGHVQDEVFAHDGEANQADVSFFFARLAAFLDRHYRYN
jgi:hypothetical protein